MKTISCVATWVIISASAIHSCFSQTRPATTSQSRLLLPSDISDALTHEVSAVSPAVTIAWVETRQPPLNPADYADATGFKKFDHHKTFIQQDKMELTWQIDGHYLLAFHQFFLPSGSEKAILRFNLRYSFDGNLFYQRGANPDEVHCIIRSDYEDQAASDDVINMDYFRFIGLPLPADAVTLQNHTPLMPTILLLLSSDKNTLTAIEPITVDGTPLVCLKILRAADSPSTLGDFTDSDKREGEDDFYLDPARSYVQVRFEQFGSDGKRVFRVDCTDIRAFPERKTFLPFMVVATQSDPFAEETLSVKHVDFKTVPAEKFVPTDTDPGTWFIDCFKMKQVVHVLQKDGTLKLKKNF